MSHQLRYFIFVLFTGGAALFSIIALSNIQPVTGQEEAHEFYGHLLAVIACGLTAVACAVIAGCALNGLRDPVRSAPPYGAPPAMPPHAVPPPVPPQGHVPPMQQQLPPPGVPYPGASGPQQSGQPGQPGQPA